MLEVLNSGSGPPLSIVTGANQGFGFGLTNLLLKEGHEVVMACRNCKAAQAAGERFDKGNGKYVVMALDLSDLKSVVTFAKEFEEKYKGRALMYLFLNAGIVKLFREYSRQGLEETYAVNHFGGVALFNLLLNNVLIPSRTRVVSVGSLVHANGNVAVGHDLTGQNQEFSTASFYSNSKLFNSLWGFQVQKRFGAVGVSCNSVHPGSGFFTNLGRGDASLCLRIVTFPILLLAAPFAWCLGFFQTWHDGGVAELAAAQATDGGQYFYRHWPSQASETARDEHVQDWLWAETQRILAECAVKFDLPAEIAALP